MIVTFCGHSNVADVANVKVWLYEIIGGGHSWATRDIDTGDEIWLFFSRFIK